MAHEKIVTLFDTAQQAEAAKRNLEKAGFSEHDISLISGERLEEENEAIHHPSIWKRLFGDNVEDEYAGVYTTAIDTGGVVLTVRAHEDEVAKAMAILDAHDAVDIPARARGEGLSYSTAPDYSDENLTTSTTSLVADRDLHASLTGDETQEEILRLAEERLEVGKRLVKEGSTRVRRYVTTENVTADIALTDEHADVFRRVINEPVAHGNIDWSEKVVEVTETREQPVVNKTAQIIEEVVIRKDTTERVETVTDTVRRQEVDIDRVDENSGLRGTALDERDIAALGTADSATYDPEQPGTPDFLSPADKSKATNYDPTKK